MLIEILDEFASYSPQKDVIAARYKPHFTEAQFAKVSVLSILIIYPIS